MFFRMKLGRCPRSTAGQLLNKMSNTQDLYLLRVQEYGPSTAKWRPLLGSLQSTVLLTYRQLFRDMKGNEGKFLIWSLVRGTLWQLVVEARRAENSALANPNPKCNVGTYHSKSYIIVCSNLSQQLTYLCIYSTPIISLHLFPIQFLLGCSRI